MDENGVQAITIYQFIGGSLASAIDTYITPATGRLIDALAVSAGTFIYIYLWCFFAAILFGLTQRPMTDLARVGFRYILVGSIALTPTMYDSTVVGFFSGLEADLVGIMAGTDGDATSIYQVLDATFQKALGLLVVCYDRANALGWRDYDMVLLWRGTGLLIGVAAGGLTLIGAIAIIVAKLMLHILFAIGPLFIFCIIFPPLGRFFDGWVASVLNKVLVTVFVGVTMTFALAMFSSYIDGVSFDGVRLPDGSIEEQNPAIVLLLIALVATALGFVVHAAKSEAASLAGGLAMSAITLRQSAQMAMSPISNTASAARAANDAANPRSTRRDLESGIPITARRLDHLAAGNTWANPKYAQEIARNAGRHWARASGGSAKKG